MFVRKVIPNTSDIRPRDNDNLFSGKERNVTDIKKLRENDIFGVNYQRNKNTKEKIMKKSGIDEDLDKRTEYRDGKLSGNGRFIMNNEVGQKTDNQRANRAVGRFFSEGQDNILLSGRRGISGAKQASNESDISSKRIATFTDWYLIDKENTDGEQDSAKTGGANISDYQIYNGNYPAKLDDNKVERIDGKFIPNFNFGNLKIEEKNKFWQSFKGKKLVYATIFLLFIASGAFVNFAFNTRDKIEKSGNQALIYLERAKIDLLADDFESARNNLSLAESGFAVAKKETDKLGGQLLTSLAHIPYLSKASTGRNVVVLGDNLTKALGELTKISELMKGVKNPLENVDDGKPTLTDILLAVRKKIVFAETYLNRADEAGQKIRIDDLPLRYQKKMRKLKEVLPLVKNNLNDFNRVIEIFLELLGHNGPRRYLIVFENNQEMRATGGFIGSYGLLQTNKGRVENLKIEGIYNPDGQLKVNVVPPRPIQKISAAWSTHDANWWPDFSKSARKIAWFYEKTGGPTTDGVIAMTPVVLQKLLEVTGPIEMPEYKKIVTSKNFVEIIQSEVERDFKQRNEKEKNKKSDGKNIKKEESLETKLAIENRNKKNEEVVKDPKKILADLAPKLLGRVFNVDGLQRSGKVLQALLTSLREKHILLYFSEPKVQKIVSEQGWSGEVLQTDKDYLMVINTNINGFKTDGVIKEMIKEEVDIGEDGKIVDTLTITRRHLGGETKYEWWNKVNADYLRVYIPQGSKLLSASGYTREMNEERLDYDRLGFQIDKDVEKEERYMKIDPETGTRIYNENGKTVFANWVYVSPGETVTLVYKYELPFKLDWQKGVTRYSLLAQKQSGSIGSDLEVVVKLPKDVKVGWWEPNDLKFKESDNLFSWKTNLREDRFAGLVIKKSVDESGAN